MLACDVLCCLLLWCGVLVGLNRLLFVVCVLIVVCGRSLCVMFRCLVVA